MNSNKVKISLIQHPCTGSKQENIDEALRLIREAAADGAEIICTQELFSGTYFPQTVDVAKYDWAELVPGPTTEIMRKTAEELGVVIIVSLYEQAMAGVYFNTVVVFDADGTDLGKYRKNHIPEGPQYLEKYYFTPGDLGYPVFKTRFGTIGVLICWDEWFPEASRILALKGAEIVFYPSAIGSEPDNPELNTAPSWRTAVSAHGIHNNMFIAAVNRVGREKSPEGYMDFYGTSFISNPWGAVIAEAETGGSEVISAVIDLNEIKKARDILQFHRDRRPDTYAEILKRVIE